MQHNNNLARQIKSKIPEYVRTIMEIFIQHGVSIWCTGGALRDILTGYEPEDFDLTTDINWSKIKYIAEKNHLECTVLNENLSVCRVGRADWNYVEIASLRREGKYADGIPKNVEFTDVALDEDACRRDFTVNAMYWSLLEGLEDPLNGRKDCRKRLLVPVSKGKSAEEKAYEDPVRMMRGLRFISEKYFAPSESFIKTLEMCGSEIEKIASERMRKEFLGILKGKNAAETVNLMMKTGILKYITGISEYRRLQFCENTYNFVKSHHDKISNQVDMQSDELLAAFCIYVHKTWGNVVDINRLKQRLQLSSVTVKKISTLINAEKLEYIADSYSLKKYIATYGIEEYSSGEKILNLLRNTWNCGSLDGYKFVIERERILKRIEEKREPIFIGDLKINGNQIIETLKSSDISDYSAVRKILKELLKCVHRNPELNRKEVLISLAKQIVKEK